MNRVFVRSEEAYTDDFTACTRLNIGVVGLSAGAGSTFVATSLAHLLSRDKGKSVAFVEAAEYMRIGDESRSRLFDAMGMDKRFALREYTDIFEAAERGESIRQIMNIDNHVNWAVPMQKGKGDEAVVARVLSGIAGDIIICDIGSSFFGEALKGILGSMDFIICVADPAPSALIAGENRLSLIRQSMMRSSIKGFMLVNKMSAGVDRRAVRKFLGSGETLTIDALSTAEIQSYEYSCRIPAESRAIREKLSDLERVVKIM